tara:strand:+ start:11239 stop:12630 length:1392 start_codon:yes stop_codon:yes gene_type:complete
MKYLISSILTILLFSCNNTKNKNTITYFGGQIINPKSNYVLFLKDDKIIDTLKLDSENRFIKGFKSLNEGLYIFKHGIEFQYVYLEPKDSVLVRLNTWDFDESIVYTGNGSSKNEFLINLFIQNEKEEKAMFKYFSLNEKKFQFKIDSLGLKRDSIYNEFTANELHVSKGFKKLTNAAIHYPLYRLKEAYPYYYKKANKLPKFPKVSEDFYNFRNDVNLNEANLLSFYPYRNYVINYLYNLSYQLRENDSTKTNLTLNILNAIVENIDLEDFRNALLKEIVVEDFLKSETTCTTNTETLAVFLDNCTHEEYINQVKNLVNDSKFVLNNKPLTNFEIESIKGEILNANTIIKNKNTVIYFWSTEYMSFDYLVKRIQYLEKNNPRVMFIGINMNPDFQDIMLKSNLNLLNSNNQYKLTKDSYANQFLTSRYPRTIMINKEGIVTNGFTYLDSPKFSSELIKLELN